MILRIGLIIKCFAEETYLYYIMIELLQHIFKDIMNRINNKMFCRRDISLLFYDRTATAYI